MDFVFRTIVRRIIYIAIAAIFAFLSGYAKADYTVSPTYRAQRIVPVTDYPTLTLACQATRDYVLANLPSNSSTTSIQITYYSDSCDLLLNNGQNGVQSANVQKLQICGITAGAYSNGLCSGTCPTPTILNPTTNQCETPNNCVSTLTIAGIHYVPVRQDVTIANITKADAATTVCKNGCEAKLNPYGADWYLTTNSTTGLKSIEGSLKQTGNACTPATVPTSASTTPQTEQDCMNQGKGFATINGVTTCAKAGTAGMNNPVNITDKSTTTTNNNVTSTTNTTTNTSVNANNTVTTTTTKTNPDGTTETAQKEQDKPSFCEENPKSKICKDDEGEFGGSCSSAFTCKGDAIQCAIAKDQHKRNCEAFEKTTPLSDLGNSLANGNDPQGGTNPTDSANIEVINVNSQFNQTNPFSSGDIQDINVTIQGQQIAIPFSKTNEALRLMGAIILATSLIIGARILYGAVQ